MDKQPSMMEMMKMGADSELRAEFYKLNEVMGEEGIRGNVMEVLGKLGGGK